MSIAIGVMFAMIGVLLLALAGPVSRLAIRNMEWQLSLMRRPWFVWHFRAFGIIFALSGLSLFFSRPE
ncbi:hypothetical protein [Sphingomonas bacterium]|uniref:hypothetical protein n=1 Tax=Sphingomonas bacterium TaxID=1895847 RepID=UPI0015775146|nr:hypothetical protein [Sphingomonas bacterium]